MVDLDLVCEDAHVHCHKVVMAASSKFFHEQLCRSPTVRGAPVILRLEDFNLKLKREAVSFLVEFIYKGETVIPAEILSGVCEAAHSLGIHGLTDFLPAPAKKANPPRLQESGTQIDDEALHSNTTNSSDSNSNGNTQNQQTQQIVNQWQSLPNGESFGMVQDFFQQQAATEMPPFQGGYSQASVQNNAGYKPLFYNQDSNFIIDLENNSMDGTTDQPPMPSSSTPSSSAHSSSTTEPVQSNPKGRLRIINQGPMTENIHDIKTNHASHSHQANLETHSSNSFLNWMPNIGLEQQQQANFDPENSMWYGNQMPAYTEEGSSWTTPAAPAMSSTSSQWPSNSETEEDSSGVNNASQNSENRPSSAAKVNKSSSDEVKMRPPPPLLAKGSATKRPELEVRKDLTLPTAPTAREDNVFEADEDLPISLDEASASQFECLQCSMAFGSDSQLRSHVRHAHKNEESMLSCPICKTTVLYGLENLKVHLYKSHGIGKVFRCEDCNYETSVKSNFIKHSKVVHTQNEDGGEKLRLCPKCGKAFKSRCGLKLHIQTHNANGDLHACSFCDFKTPQKVNLVKHLAVKHKKNEQGDELKMNKACPLCSYKCVADHMLKTHMLRKHTSKDKMKYQCSQCDYASVEAAALKKHIRFKHTNERPYMCSTCGFSTHTHSAMARHKRGHQQSKPYVCETCGMAYADRKRLRDHEAAIHQTATSGSVPQPFDCDFCGYSTRRKDNLQAHIKRLHPEMASQKPSTSLASHIVGHVNQDGSIRPIHNESDTNASSKLN